MRPAEWYGEKGSFFGEDGWLFGVGREGIEFFAFLDWWACGMDSLLTCERKECRTWDLFFSFFSFRGG